MSIASKLRSDLQPKRNGLWTTGWSTKLFLPSRPQGKETLFTLLIPSQMSPEVLQHGPYALNNNHFQDVFDPSGKNAREKMPAGFREQIAFHCHQRDQSASNMLQGFRGIDKKSSDSWRNSLRMLWGMGRKNTAGNPYSKQLKGKTRLLPAIGDRKLSTNGSGLSKSRESMFR